MQTSAKEQTIIRTGFEVVKIVDVRAGVASKKEKWTRNFKKNLSRYKIDAEKGK